MTIENRKRGLSFRSQQSVPGTEYRRPGSRERIVAADGNINGNSKRDLMMQISHLIDARERGHIDDRPERYRTQASIAEKNEMIKAALFDKSSNDWAQIGASMAGELTESADRQGFMRQLLKKEDVTQGNLPRIRVRKKRVTAITKAGAGYTYPIIARDQYYYPPEFTIDTNVRVEHREINQGTGDIMEDKFLEAQEQTMRNEDLYWTQLAQTTVGVVNQQVSLVGGLTPASLAFMRDQIERWNIPATTVVMSSIYWTDITSNTSFGAWFDPLSKYEIVQTGFLGHMLGMQFITDAYRNPQLQVLNQGDLYMVGQPENHGAYTTRGPIQSTEVNGYQDGQPARGFYMWEDLSMLVFNPRSVTYGLRTP